MSRLRNVALSVAIVAAVLAGPAALLTLILLRPAAWLDTLKNYQTLAGSLAALFAAGLATVGAWMSITVQRENMARQYESTREQIAAQRQSTSEELRAAEARAAAERDEQRRTVALERHLAVQQLASGFAGEVTAIVHVLRLRLPAGTLNQVAALAKKGLPNGTKLNLAIGFDLTPVYRAQVGNLGQLPAPLPERLAAFYGRVAAFLDELEKLDKFEDPNAGSAAFLALKFEEMEKDLDRLIGIGTDLYTSLARIQDDLFLWPPAAPRLAPGQIATLAEMLEKELTPDEQNRLLAANAHTSDLIAALERARAAKRAGAP